METHSPVPDARGAEELLAHLDADRTALAPHVTTPTWYLTGMAGLAAVFVAAPLLGDRRSGLLTPLLAGALVLVTALRQRRLVRPAGGGVAAGGTLAVLIGALLVLLSTSFGLVAADLHPWVALPVLAAGALTFLLGRRLDRIAQERLARVR
ncbi:hypothetical protein J1G43_02345 [Cellulomonas sp. zg-ZUI22]|uniref:hypothetical protein n=1 Tax=Cellulomonas sp. zg-ZUI22 TaxID=2816955 RepID=UPI001A949836|nr:hypothetical protein [Cellulomonas sp. zg-ZUI22]MBO0898804.1 hypothetical protein [Cellulomonas sp. zg-ZUI22]